MKVIEVIHPIHLLPKHSMISLVRVDLLLSSKASDAAFLIKMDPAMQPNIVGFILCSASAARCRAQDRNSATLKASKGINQISKVQQSIFSYLPSLSLDIFACFQF